MLKDEIDRKFDEVSHSVEALIEVFLEQLKDKRGIDLFLLKNEAIWGKKNLQHAQKLLSWVETVTHMNSFSPAQEKQIVIQLVLSPSTYLGMVRVLNKLNRRKAFTSCEELKNSLVSGGNFFSSRVPCSSAFLLSMRNTVNARRILTSAQDASL